MGKLFDNSEPQFLHLRNGEITAYLRFLVGLAKIIYGVTNDIPDSREMALIITLIHILFMGAILGGGWDNLATGMYSQKNWIQHSFQKLSGYGTQHCFT